KARPSSPAWSMNCHIEPTGSGSLPLSTSVRSTLGGSMPPISRVSCIGLAATALALGRRPSACPPLTVRALNSELVTTTRQSRDRRSRGAWRLLKAQLVDGADGDLRAAGQPLNRQRARHRVQVPVVGIDRCRTALRRREDLGRRAVDGGTGLPCEPAGTHRK